MRINQAISEKQKEYEDNNKLVSRLEYLEENIDKQSFKLRALLSHMKALGEEIQELEESSLLQRIKHLFKNTKVLLEQKREQLLTENALINTIEEELKLMTQERDLIKSKYRSPSSIEKELQDLTSKKYFQLKSSDTKFSKALFAKESEIGRYKLQIQKASTGIKRGEIVRKQCDVLEHELLTVQEKIFGSSSFTDSERRRYINLSSAKSKTLQARLGEYQESINSIDPSISFNHDIEVFDGLLAYLKSAIFRKPNFKTEVGACLRTFGKIKTQIKSIESELKVKKKEWMARHDDLYLDLQKFIQDF